ncbi:MAG: HAD family phosphatase [Tildeniella nuda ZEHNDER 1965/U140]|jgi:HAD superfamily hydrolase (TIGR01509 family)|nr:HAD family phosphatase [Tildeniella nuda ZEHNDER 1965/U140]
MTSPLSNQVPAAIVPPKLAAILYDLDGTLVNTDPLHFQVWQAMLREFGLDIDEAFYQTKISGRLNPAIVQDLLPYLSPAEQQQFIQQKESRFREQSPQLTPLRGLEKVMQWATEHGLKQGVVTNAPTENVYHVLKALHLEETFDQVVIADVLGIGKPDPTPYSHALKQFSLSPKQAIAFEDSPSGMRSAVAAGIPTIGIASTHDPETLYSLGAMLVVPDFAAAELWQWLRTTVNRF